jgi:two-component system LytT family response regulator
MSEPPQRPPIRTIVVDDEAPARALLRELLGDDPRFALIAECANGFEAVKQVAELAPELLLLDIQMPKLDGFEVLELLGDDAPAVVFITAYDEHAVRAFEVQAVDYLLKPFDSARLATALARVERRLEAGAAAPPARQLAEAARPPAAAGARPPDRVLIREGSSVHVLAGEQIDYVEAAGDQLRFHIRERRPGRARTPDARAQPAGPKVLSKTQTMAEAEARLDPSRFVRIHRSYLLNLDRLSEIELYAKDSRVVILKTGERLPLSRAGYARLRELL